MGKLKKKEHQRVLFKNLGEIAIDSVEVFSDLYCCANQILQGILIFAQHFTSFIIYLILPGVLAKMV